MKSITLPYPHGVVNNAIVDTIKIMNQYKLDKKQYEGKNRIWCQNGYLDFILSSTDSTISKLELWGKQDLFEDDFEQNFMRVVEGRAIITPEVMNKDPYKEADKTNLFVTILALIVALVAVLYWASIAA